MNDVTNDYVYEKMLETEKISDAYERWADYRYSMTEYICGKVDAYNHIGIFGAGALNDIDLWVLLEKGVQVDLLDYDTKTVLAGIQKQLGSRMVDYVTKEQLRVIAYDVWPVDVTFYHELEELFMAQTPMNVVIDALQHLTEKNTTQPLPDLAQYDVLVCMGFHSQIMVHFVALLQHYVRAGICMYDAKDVGQFQQQIGKMNQCMARHLQEQFANHCTRMILSYEYATFDVEDARIYEVIDLLYKGNMAEISEFNLSRVEGALQLEQWIGDAFYGGRIRILENAYAIWPFSQDKNYLMALYEITK